MKTPHLFRATALAVISAACLNSGCGDTGGHAAGARVARDYAQEMRAFVQSISAYARGVAPDFAVIPNDGFQLLSADGTPGGTPAMSYVQAISGVAQEDILYGHTGVDSQTPTWLRDELLEYLELARGEALPGLVIDYCSVGNNIDDFYAQCDARGLMGFAADRLALDDIPIYPRAPHDENTDEIVSLADARNFLCLINPMSYGTQDEFLTALRSTNYDVLIVDAFFHEAGDALTREDVSSLQTKANGHRRLVLSYLSIGQAEIYRYYWSPEWADAPPAWLDEENPDWPGEYKVRYWDPAWQAIIYGNDDSYLRRILDAGFDGVFLDNIDAFEFFEANEESGLRVSSFASAGDGVVFAGTWCGGVWRLRG